MRHYFNFCFYDETSKAHYSLVLFFFISVCVLPVQKLQARHLKVLITAEMHIFFLPRTGYEISRSIKFFLGYIGEG